MRLTLAGVKRGRRAVVWSNVFRFAAVMVPLPAIFTGVIYKVATKLWSLNAFLLGLAGGVVLVILVVIGALCTELRKMPILPDKLPGPPPPGA